MPESANPLVGVIGLVSRYQALGHVLHAPMSGQFSSFKDFMNWQRGWYRESLGPVPYRDGFFCVINKKRIEKAHA
ncbi:uncharacterized protein METZ01_LOCUS28578 [marine metagenome]|uniref:Uncharacterized protein n=1 Tax=marine metagenome TaxID=408172 RepID=A0A381QA49_9ZZZZ